MPIAPCRFIKRIAEFVPADRWDNVPDNTRGIYALLQETDDGHYDVIYVGMSARSEKAGIYSRLSSHQKNNRFKGKFTHFTIFEVHDNITADEVREIEGLFRHMYRKDSVANQFNKQLCHKPFQRPDMLVSDARTKLWPWPEKKAKK